MRFLPLLLAVPASAASAPRLALPPVERLLASAPALFAAPLSAPAFLAAPGAAPALSPSPLPAASAPAAAAPVAAAPAPIDATASLLARRRAVRAGDAPPLAPIAREHRYLLVPGFSWDALPGYFGPNLARLKALGLDARLVETDPLGTLDANAERLRREVERSPTPVVLLAHSKGGLDALRMLERHPELRPKVRRLVTLQTPYRGTEAAEWIQGKPLLHAAAIAYSRLLNPRRLLATSPFLRGRAVEELTPDARARAVGAARAGVQPRTYSVVTRVDDSTAVKILLWITAGAMKALSGRHNDGVVAPESGILPGSRYALLEHVGHLDTVSDSSNWKRRALGVRGHDPRFAADLTEAIVRWIFPR